MTPAVLRAVALIGAMIASPGAAQDYPQREIRVICGYPAGSGADLETRFFANALAPLAGKPVIVENKPGALTTIAADTVARARPDGYTLLITSGNATFAANVHNFKTLSFDPLKDFTPVTTLLRVPFVLSVNPRSPTRDVASLTAHLKAKGEKAFFGYSSSFSLLATELYASLAGVAPTKVAYKGMPEAFNDLVSGAIDFQFSDATIASAQARAGRIRILAVGSAARMSSLPDVPTMIESGVPGYDMSGWWGVWLPAQAPEPVVAKLAGWFDRIVEAPETRHFLVDIAGSEPWPGDAAALRRETLRDIERFGPLFKLARIEPQ